MWYKSALRMLSVAALAVLFSTGGLTAQEKPGTKREDRAWVEVHSANWLDAHVYLVRDGVVTSLGFVTGPGEARMALPSMATVGLPIQLLVLPIGSAESYLSPPITLDRGDVAELQIENALPLSTVVVKPHG